MVRCVDLLFFFFFNDTATTEIYTLSLHDALPISMPAIVIREPSSEVVPRRTVPAFVTLMKPLKRNTPSSDRKSTRLNSSHGYISYAVFCLKKKKTTTGYSTHLRNSSNTHRSHRHS